MNIMKNTESKLQADFILRTSTLSIIIIWTIASCLDRIEGTANADKSSKYGNTCWKVSIFSFFFVRVFLCWQVNLKVSLAEFYRKGLFFNRKEKHQNIYMRYIYIYIISHLYYIYIIYQNIYKDLKKKYYPW